MIDPYWCRLDEYPGCEAVDLALRRLVGPRLSPEFFASLRGIGWEGDLEGMRRSTIQEIE